MNESFSADYSLLVVLRLGNLTLNILGGGGKEVL